MNEFPGEFWWGFLGGLSGAFCLGNTRSKNSPRKSTAKFNQRLGASQPKSALQGAARAWSRKFLQLSWDLGGGSRVLVETYVFKNTIFKHSGASKMASTKARLLKHEDFYTKPIFRSLKDWPMAREGNMP